MRSLPLLGGPPVLLDNIECRRIGGQACHLAAWAIEGVEQARRFLGSTEATLDEQPRALVSAGSTGRTGGNATHSGGTIRDAPVALTEGYTPCEGSQTRFFSDGKGQ
jgi:hypothetical protein